MLELLHDLCQFWAHQLAEEPRHRPEHVRVGGDRPLSSSEHVPHPLPLGPPPTSLSIHGCAHPEEFVSVLKLGFPDWVCVTFEVAVVAVC